jgi:hypothetical protein
MPIFRLFNKRTISQLIVTKVVLKLTDRYVHIFNKITCNVYGQSKDYKMNKNIVYHYNKTALVTKQNRYINLENDIEIEHY